MFGTFACVRRSLWIAILVALAAFGHTAYLAAEAPMQKTQAPGYYRMMLGEFEITALFDGIVDLDAGLLKNVSETDVRDLLARALIADPHKIPASTSGYLINTGKKLVLVDTGGGAAFGAGLGHLAENLAASGYKPEQVDAVLITHLHPDHVGGLVNAQGKPVFSNAVVYLAKAENDYWLSDVEPSVPAAYKEHLKQARQMVANIAKPYLAKNRWKTFENGSVARGTEEVVGKDPGEGEGGSRQPPPSPLVQIKPTASGRATLGAKPFRRAPK